MTTLGQRLALVELAEVRRELGVLGEKLDDVIVALGGDVLDLRDAESLHRQTPGVQSE